MDSRLWDPITGQQAEFTEDIKRTRVQGSLRRKQIVTELGTVPNAPKLHDEAAFGSRAFRERRMAFNFTQCAYVLDKPWTSARDRKRLSSAP